MYIVSLTDEQFKIIRKLILVYPDKFAPGTEEQFEIARTHHAERKRVLQELLQPPNH